MISPKLTSILRTFSKSELKEFEKFIASPYFNKGRNYIPFLNQLVKFYPKFDDEKLTHEYIFARLYPGKKFSKQIIWNMISSLQNMAEEFLIYVSLGKDKFTKSKLLADEFLNRNLPAFQAKKLDEMEKSLEKAGISVSYFRNKSALESGRMSYHFLEDTQHLLSRHILKKGEYSILNMMREITTVINDIQANSVMFNAKFDFNIPGKFVDSLEMEKVIDYAKKNKYEYTFIMEMLHCSIMTVLQFDESKYFFRLKELFEKNLDKFSDNEKLSWITTLSNYCTLKSNKGDFSYRETLFEINQLELQVSTKKQYLSKILFIQVLRNALSINKTEWVHNYIQQYSNRLKPSYQKPMRALAMAYLNQKLKDFPKVLENLKDVKFIDVRDKFNVKAIYVRTYFETREIEMLLYQIDSMKHFLHSNSSISEYTRNNMMRFLNYMTNLVSAMEKKDQIEIGLLGRKIEKDNEMPFREWMLSKVAEIKKGA